MNSETEPFNKIICFEKQTAFFYKTVHIFPQKTVPAADGSVSGDPEHFLSIAPYSFMLAI
jgi:hypothetical protein